MKKKWLTIILAAVCFTILTGSAYAWTSEIEGKPFRLASGSGAAGYYVWQDNYGFYIWMLPGGGSHEFIGTIRTNGSFNSVRGHHLDGGESFQAYPEIQDRFWFETMNPAGNERFVFQAMEAECDAHKIFFKIRTDDGSDGIHFNVTGASYVSFDLLIDGRGAERKQIWYGGSSWHPETNVFKFENK